ncbi:MAG: calcium/sodium antiporter [Gammaproteobacteria bacterium]
MLVTLLTLLLGLTLLYVGAEGLVRGASCLGLKLGLTPLVIGLTVVAFGTSAPELLVSVQAGIADQGAIAIGNVVGSNIANIGLILGLAALVRPINVRAQLVRFELPLVIAVSVLLTVLLWNGLVGRIEGLLLFLGVIAFTVYSLRAARAKQAPEVEAEFAESMPAAERPTWQYVVLTLVGLAVLVVGARVLVSAAVDIARALGLSEALIGLTIIAIGTSLPELAASMVAAAKREGDIAVGNVLGSNLFNILCVVGLAALIVPLEAGGVSHIDLAVMIAIAVVLLPIMRTRFVIGRIEGAGLVLIYAGYLAWLAAGA